ncbi:MULTISPECIES: hypothetical protein [unclassified Pseudoxanthomonas]|uniref:hypothetical protein n=1 Tax=unclassified Pseudoxanthomonas TaxID=2645906 RepID=UPI0008E1BD49|nr:MULTISPECIES: hypothetical protein [unclassified Pseudoxanthomonas]PPJ42738.1 hypothetical protein C0063_05645 [Pseudoxanthomonas sp. KAs_5_3]SFV26392.1 hypothetical protein SAMN05428990_0296 [Pseudoxanthomonas sp. YR558]
MDKRYVSLLLAAVFAFAAAPGFAGKHDPMDIPVYERVESTNGIPPSAARIKAAILHAGKTRGWTMVESEPGRVTLRYAPRTHEVVVAVRYDDNGFKIEYVSSVEMNYRVKGNTPEIHGNYNRWIRNLSQDIQMSPVFHRVEAAAP